VRIEKLVVNIDGRFFSGGPVRDGGEATLEAGNRLEYGGNQGASRFSADVTQAVVHRAIEHRQFLARIEGDGFVPTGGIGAELNSSEHWVRGEFEESKAMGAE
jgi:hypothetical protein